MTRALLWLAVVAASVPASVLGQTGVPAPPPTSAVPPATAPPPTSAGSPISAAPPVLEPPRALTATAIDEPPGAPPHDQPIVVKVKLRVGVDGTVKLAELLTRSLPVFDDWVLAAVKRFQFAPATYGGKPVQVEISFTHTFLPPPPPPLQLKPSGPVLSSVLRGKLVEKGTRLPVRGATVSVLIDGEHYDAQADNRGRFRLPVPPGQATVTVHAPAYKKFLQTEVISDKQEIAIAYFIERERYDPYEVVVIGEQKREELSRVTLKGPEIRQIPGTFGDPFRVVQTLPGVSSVASLLPFPVVRGASPSSTGILVDGTRVPLLYHLLIGSSVISPEFIDEIQFYPGGAPVLYGGYTGGIVDGKTRRARRDEKLIDLDANLLQTGGLVRYPIPALGSTLTAAGRVGYPGYIITLATDQASLSYWDYQLRLDGGTARKGWTAFSFGAHDQFDTAVAGSTTTPPTLTPALIFDFHRLDLRAQYGTGPWDATMRLVTGLDQTTLGNQIEKRVLEPTARLRWKPDATLDVTVGAEAMIHRSALSSPTLAVAGNAQAFSGTNSFFQAFTATQLDVYSGLGEALYRPTPRWLIRPGVRADWRSDGTTSAGAFDPRLSVRYRLAQRDLPDAPTASDASAVWLKAGVGVYHQPPRISLPLPGFDTLPLKYGLLKAVQASLGVEMPFEQGLSVNLEAFYNDMNPVVFDLTFNPASVTKAAQNCLILCQVPPAVNQVQQNIDRIAVPSMGRAYGLETLIRRQSKSGVYGWLSYTLSLSERQQIDGNWKPFDVDRTHLLNLVFGLPLPRNWDVGVRFQYQSGKPATTTYGYNTARSDGFFRIDARVDKRAVWNKWLFDFYVDLTNISLAPEEVFPGAAIRVILPTAGVRARF
jgi:hypothetical protein